MPSTVTENRTWRSPPRPLVGRASVAAATARDRASVAAATASTSFLHIKEIYFHRRRRFPAAPSCAPRRAKYNLPNKRVFHSQPKEGVTDGFVQGDLLHAS